MYQSKDHVIQPQSLYRQAEVTDIYTEILSQIISESDYDGTEFEEFHKGNRTMVLSIIPAIEGTRVLSYQGYKSYLEYNENLRRAEQSKRDVEARKELLMRNVHAKQGKRRRNGPDINNGSWATTRQKNENLIAENKKLKLELGNMYDCLTIVDTCLDIVDGFSYNIPDRPTYSEVLQLGRQAFLKKAIAVIHEKLPSGASNGEEIRKADEGINRFLSVVSELEDTDKEKPFETDTSHIDHDNELTILNFMKEIKPLNELDLQRTTNITSEDEIDSPILEFTPGNKKTRKMAKKTKTKTKKIIPEMSYAESLKFLAENPLLLNEYDSD